MNEAKKQNIKKSLQDTIRHLAEALESIKEANGIIHKEIEQLYIGRLLTHKKGASQEMFDLSEDKACLRGLDERLHTYIADLNNIANKYN